jgi:hypothetical protein
MYGGVVFPAPKYVSESTISETAKRMPPADIMYQAVSPVLYAAYHAEKPVIMRMKP